MGNTLVSMQEIQANEQILKAVRRLQSNLSIRRACSKVIPRSRANTVDHVRVMIELAFNQVEQVSASKDVKYP